MSQTQTVETSTLATSAIYTTLTLTLIVFVYEYWLRNQRYYKLGMQIPGLPMVPIFGNALLALGKSPNDIFLIAMKYYKTLKSDVVRIWLGPTLLVALLDPKDIELILGSNVHLEKSPQYQLFEPWLGDGLLISKGEKWKTHRKMIAPTFHSSILKSFMPVFNKNANNLIVNFENELGKTFDVHDYMSGATVDTLLETAMGVTKTSEDNTGFQYAKAVMDMCEILHLRQVKFWLLPDITFNLTKMSKIQGTLLNIIHSLTRSVIQRKKQNYLERKSKGEVSLYDEVRKEKYNEKSGLTEESIMNTLIKDDLDENDENDIGEKKRLAFLDFMIEANQSQGNKLTDDEIKEEVDTIMFEGHDTTAAGSSFALCLLGIYKDIQDKVVEELREIFQDDFNRPVTFNDTLQMKYLERVILETLRLYPPVPLIARKVNTDLKLASGDYTVPAGTTVLLGFFLTHRNPKYWENPTVFDPDRFLPENCQNRSYYAYTPFSAGPRSCVGRKYAMLKLKVLLASVLRKFEFHSIAREEDFKLQGDIILKRADGFKIRVTRRNNPACTKS